MSSETVTYNDLYRILKEIIPMTHKSSKVGEIIVYAGATAPFGWKICDGSAISRTEFADLFSVIGTTYGAGDGSTTFNIPDLRGSFPIGADITYSLGSTGGAETVTLNAAQIPAHGHNVKNWVDAGTLGTAKYWTNNGTTYADTPSGRHFTGASGTWTTGTFTTAQSGTGDQTGLTDQQGGGQAHENMPPYLSVNYIICCKSSDSNVENVAIDLLYPVGCYFETSDTTFNPNISWGGTWASDDNLRETKKLLWTNTSLTPIGAQTIQLNLSGYTHIEVVALTINSLDEDGDPFIYGKAPVGQAGFVSRAGLSLDNTTDAAHFMNIITRDFYSTTSGVTFGNGQMTYAGNAYPNWSDRATPYKIFGIKQTGTISWHRTA